VNPVATAERDRAREAIGEAEATLTELGGELDRLAALAPDAGWLLTARRRINGLTAELRDLVHETKRIGRT